MRDGLAQTCAAPWVRSQAFWTGWASTASRSWPPTCLISEAIPSPASRVAHGLTVRSRKGRSASHAPCCGAKNWPCSVVNSACGLPTSWLKVWFDDAQKRCATSSTLPPIRYHRDCPTTPGRPVSALAAPGVVRRRYRCCRSIGRRRGL